MGIDWKQSVQHYLSESCLFVTRDRAQLGERVILITNR